MSARIPFADLSRAARAEEAGLKRAFARVLKSGWFVLGPEVEAFEAEFAAFASAGHGVGCASGTDAITLALRALGIGPGDEVLSVSMTCAPTATAILRAGATPVLVDVEDETLTMDPARLEEAVTSRTRAVVPVHLYGRPAPMEKVADFAIRHGLAIVEDCAQAHGARVGGRPVGTWGAAAAWSFYPTKNLGALGDGGLVTTDDPRVAERLRRLRVYGYASRNDAQEAGWNSRLDELQAAILRERLARLPQGNARRADLARRYDTALAGSVRTPPAPRDGEVQAHHLYVVRASARDLLRRRLASAGIGTGVHYPRAVHQQPAFQGLARVPERGLPVTERAVAEILSLPLYPELLDGEADEAAETLVRAVRAG